MDLVKYLGVPRAIETRTILSYFKPDSKQARPKSSKSSNISLFDLPFDIRRRIYQYAGLVDGMVIDLNYMVPKAEECRKLDSMNDVDKPNCDMPYHGTHGTSEGTYDDLDLYPETFSFWDSNQFEQLPTISKYSRSISRFVDGPVSHPYIRLNRPCQCGRLQIDEESLDLVSGDDGPVKPGCSCDPLPSELLYVNPRLTKELTALFFSQSHFRNRKSDLGGLSTLLSLSPLSFTWLTSLSLRLNSKKCNLSIEQCALRHHRDSQVSICKASYYFMGLLSKSTTRQDKARVSEWERLCSYMAKYITPNRLRLSIIAEVSDIEAAEEVVAPLLRLPVLRQCCLFLSEDSKMCMVRLARQTVLEVTGSPNVAPPVAFLFLDLPLEIQIRILEFTELTTPYDLAWTAEKDGPCESRFFELRSLESLLCLDFIDEPYDFKCCGSCTDKGEVCYCSSRCSAASSTCRCWEMPALFCVNQYMRHLAMSVFYAMNHFVILPSISPLHIQPYEMLQFLTSVPATHLKYLRSISWILPTAIGALLRCDQKPYLDWLEFVDICGQHMNLPKLNLSIDMSLSMKLEQEGLLSNRLPEEVEFTVICNLVTAMTKYTEWGNFAIHLSNPFDEGNFEDGELGDREEAFEQMVMGDSYDACKNWKHNRMHSPNGYDCSEWCDGRCDIWPLVPVARR